MRNLIGYQIDRYRLISQQGIGGMAVVYHAYDVNLERDVALKLIRSDAFAEDDYSRLMKRFEREAKAQSSFSHPNIAPVYNYGNFEGMPYFIMAFYSGGTLKDRMGNPVGLEQAINWIFPLADALSYAHQRGVIHRDFKPSNILFDNKGNPVLTDFGIAKLLEESEGTLTETGFGVGTPEYMSPEQWHGKATQASDQYALGVVLYELITGRKPYSAETPVAVALKQMNDPLIQPSAYVPQIPEEVEKLLYKALAQNPEDRFESVRIFADALIEIQPRLAGLMREKQKRIDAGEFTPQPVDNREITSESRTIDLLDPINKVTPEDLNLTGQKTKGKRKNRGFIFAGILLALLALAFAVWRLLPGLFQPSTESTNEAILDVNEGATQKTEMELFEEKSTPAITTTEAEEIYTTPTLAISPTPTQLANEIEITTQVREIDGMEMVFVPAGEFIFGTNRGSYSTNAGTVSFSTYDVYLDAYWIDRYEITNAQYALCVEAGVCTEPYRTSSNTRYDYYVNEAYSEYPVINVDRYKATVYCEWVGGSLPTEAQWEKAARGTDGREFPWGDYWSMEKPGNFDDYSGIDENYDGDTMSVGSFPEGASPYGAMDMLGNVWEWVADWFHPAIFATEPVDNPTGPKSGDDHMLRGGSYRTGNSLLARQSYYSYWAGLEEIGFRCVIENENIQN